MENVAAASGALEDDEEEEARVRVRESEVGEEGAVTLTEEDPKVKEGSGRDAILDGSEVESEARREKEESATEKEAWWLLNRAVVSYCGSPIGTVAANDPGTVNQMLNYDQVFIRDFVPSAIAFLLKGEGEIVRNFLLHTLQLQVKYLLFFRSNTLLGYHIGTIVV